ncbi:DUF808 domain-containing protein [Pseudaeromonas sp. ZJS20]|uniref:DUF808 domain-containing protein n=1 Tax=Pseudaeromonas aegiceratis TaxID=3153928 RepID=UPI00390CB89C
MAGTSLLALLDDIATLLDDIALMTKLGAKKTAAVLGDDLALNAQQVSGVRAERELPVVWAVAKGSLRNKLILVPLALLISALAPWLIQPLLMLGGAYLCFEGMEKVSHALWPRAEAPEVALARLQQLAEQRDLASLEQQKIRGAIRTDFILSAEIIVIALGTVQGSGFWLQLVVVSLIAFCMTIGVYALVAGIVKLDDLGFWLERRPGAGAGTLALARGLIQLAPRLMKTLSVLGTLAMFLVGGGILAHGSPHLHHGLERIQAHVMEGSLLAGLTTLGFNLLTGLLAGLLLLGFHAIWQSLRKQES